MPAPNGRKFIATRILEWWCEGWEAEAELLDDEIQEESNVVLESGCITLVNLSEDAERDSFGVTLPDGTRHRVSFMAGMLKIPMVKPVLKIIVFDLAITIAGAVEELMGRYAVGDLRLARRRS